MIAVDSSLFIFMKLRSGLLINDKNLIEEGNYNENYMITKKETFDLNKGKINTRKHKPRYVNHYYIFEEK